MSTSASRMSKFCDPRSTTSGIGSHLFCRDWASWKCGSPPVDWSARELPFDPSGFGSKPWDIRSRPLTRRSSRSLFSKQSSESISSRLSSSFISLARRLPHSCITVCRISSPGGVTGSLALSLGIRPTPPSPTQGPPRPQYGANRNRRRASPWRSATLEAQGARSLAQAKTPRLLLPSPLGGPRWCGCGCGRRAWRERDWGRARSDARRVSGRRVRGPISPRSVEL
mmetsp:Transcript_3609/g.8552  ORF Transcript_3609/g.8552 Transcript_3609/m.8552 type:complete len:226 (-) Transcript_3609:111-788(-)